MSRLHAASEELLTLIAATCDGRAEQEQFERLEQLLDGDRAAQQLLLDFYQLQADLQLRERAAHSTHLLLTQLRQAEPASRPDVLPSLSSGPWQRFLMPAAMMVALIAFFWTALLVTVGGWRPTREEATASRVQRPTLAARLTRVEASRWRGKESTLFAGAFLPEGRLLELESGLAEIRFHDGALVLLQGPAALRIESSQAALLAHGRLVAQVPREAAGFTLQTHAAEIVDLGTSFAVEVGDTQTTEVFVQTGKVAVRQRGGAANEELLLTAGQGSRIAPGKPASFVGQVAPSVYERFVWRLRKPGDTFRVVQNKETSDDELGFSAARDDLVNHDSPFLARVSHERFQPFTHRQSTSTAAALNDGQADIAVQTDPALAKGTVAFDIDGAWTSTFWLDTSQYPRGYDLSEIRTYSGWQGPRASQRYKLWLRRVGEDQFEYYGTYRLTYARSGSARITLTSNTGVIASGVAAVRFEFNPGPSRRDHTCYREIDIFGAPTPREEAAGPAGRKQN